jgi:hypothetical protein
MTTDTIVIYDSSWPQIAVKDATEAFMVSDDLASYEDGVITADEFIEVWGIHPADDWQVVIHTG